MPTPPPPPKRKLPQQSPAAGGNTQPLPPKKGTPPAGPSGGQADPGAQAAADAAAKQPPPNPNAPSANEAEAAGQGGNTTDPNGDTQPGQAAPDPGPPPDTTPLRFVVDDATGQQRHTIASQGIEALHALLGGVQTLHTRVPPEMFEQVGMAATHLHDAYRQANFGQHDGAVASIGHAAGALDRARQAPVGDPAVSKAVGDAYDTAVAVGNGIRQGNENRPPWNPLPSKSWKGLPVHTVRL